ncbi:MAG: hypothetical protein RB191_13395 [Terriglobia bacterium]|nr:hypothetical protein [Terriglobia bacterium]
MSMTTLKAALDAALQRNGYDHSAAEVRAAKADLRAARDAKRAERAARVREYDAQQAAR